MKVGAAKNWTAVTTAYNKVPFTAKVNTDLNDYATQKAISGLFYEVAQEELKIRSSTSARNSPLLQKVFGYADKINIGFIEKPNCPEGIPTEPQTYLPVSRVTKAIRCTKN